MALWDSKVTPRALGYSSGCPVRAHQKPAMGVSGSWAECQALPQGAFLRQARRRASLLWSTLAQGQSVSTSVTKAGRYPGGSPVPQVTSP